MICTAQPYTTVLQKLQGSHPWNSDSYPGSRGLLFTLGSYLSQESPLQNAVIHLQGKEFAGPFPSTPVQLSDYYELYGQGMWKVPRRRYLKS